MVPLGEAREKMKGEERFCPTKGLSPGDGEHGCSYKDLDSCPISVTSQLRGLHLTHISVN